MNESPAERLAGFIELEKRGTRHPDYDPRNDIVAVLSALEAAEADKQLLREERNLYLGDRDEARSLLAAAEADARQARAELEPFADPHNWRHNFDGAGLVYLGPYSNAVKGIELLTARAAAALGRA